MEEKPHPRSSECRPDLYEPAEPLKTSFPSGTAHLLVVSFSVAATGGNGNMLRVLFLSGIKCRDVDISCQK